MKKTITLSLCFSFLTMFSTSRATDFKQSKITQSVNDVEIISAGGQSKKTAAVNDLFTIPDILRTGPASRAELVAQDDTVTRVGANTIFSFDPANRTIDLQQGSLLFHSPHGKGGGSIHTGSATASVLGSTLIVSATPNGGFKVICLEDAAHIKLPNGLSQRLIPGQMTYILPGGDHHLAPIVLFRLDDLTTHSLLVTGFVHPLASLPLIFNEIQRQNKLIQSGRISDTGLLAGNYASADQVEVLDPNTVQKAVNSAGVQSALANDAIINQSLLTSPAVPNPPNRIFLSPAFSLPENNFYAGRLFIGFAANNISLNPSAAELNPLTVDLSPYALQPEFDLVAANDFRLQGSATFAGLSAKSSLYLVAGNQMTFAPNITLTADVRDFELVAPAAMTLNAVNIFNGVGKVGLTSGSTIDLQNIAIINAGNMTLTAPRGINLSWNSDGYLGPTGPASYNNLVADAASGEVTVASRTGSLTVVETSIQAHYLTLNSGDSILLDAAGRTLTATGAGATANFNAPNLVTVNNADLSVYGIVNMAANTINLFNVAFGGGSSVTLQSLNGLLAPNPNTGATSVPGDVNFIQNVTYGGNPAQNRVGTGILIGKLP